MDTTTRRAQKRMLQDRLLTVELEYLQGEAEEDQLGRAADDLQAQLAANYAAWQTVDARLGELNGIRADLRADLRAVTTGTGVAA